MAENQIRLGTLLVDVHYKDIKHLHLSVHPPTGKVTIAAPARMNPDAIRAFAISKLAWIKRRYQNFQNQDRKSPREFIERESHYLWGQRYLMVIAEHDGKQSVQADHKRMTLTVRPGSDQAKRARLMHTWHKTLLHEAVPPLIAKWEPILDVKVTAYFLQRMKTKWGSCNHSAGHIRLNTELIKKPRDLLEYVIVHEMVHLLEPTHNERFINLLSQYYPAWREARTKLNDLPLAVELAK